MCPKESLPDSELSETLWPYYSIQSFFSAPCFGPPLLSLQRWGDDTMGYQIRVQQKSMGRTMVMLVPTRFFVEKRQLWTAARAFMKRRALNVRSMELLTYPLMETRFGWLLTDLHHGEAAPLVGPLLHKYCCIKWILCVIRDRLLQLIK